MEYNIKDLENKIIKRKNKQIEEIDIKEIDDFEDIKVDENKIGKERILDFLIKSKNPYAFKVSGVIVRMQFSDENSISAEQCISKVLKNEYMK